MPIHISKHAPITDENGNPKLYTVVLGRILVHPDNYADFIVAMNTRPMRKKKEE